MQKLFATNIDTEKTTKEYTSEKRKMLLEGKCVI